MMVPNMFKIFSQISSVYERMMKLTRGNKGNFNNHRSKTFKRNKRKGL